MRIARILRRASYEPFITWTAWCQGIETGFEALFQFTRFHEVSYALFVKKAGGELTQEEEQMLEALGVLL